MVAFSQSSDHLITLYKREKLWLAIFTSTCEVALSPLIIGWLSSGRKQFNQLTYWRLIVMAELGIGKVYPATGLSSIWGLRGTRYCGPFTLAHCCNQCWSGGQIWWLSIRCVTDAINKLIRDLQIAIQCKQINTTLTMMVKFSRSSP